MTIITMITFSALALISLSHLAALRAQKQKDMQRQTVAVRINRPRIR